MSDLRDPRPDSPDRATRLRSACIGAVAALGLVLVSGCGSESTKKPSAEPVKVSASGLKSLSGALGQPIYWLGERSGTSYEFSQSSNRVYVRYLPSGVRTGAKAGYLTVGTYPMTNAFAVTRRLSLRSGNVRVLIPGGAVAFAESAKSTSVYAAFPKVGYQIEVYDPDPGRALGLIGTGQLTAVAGESVNGKLEPVLLSANELGGRARQLGREVYWVGPRAGVSYELSRTPDRRTYVRYLPDGVKAGASGRYLTVGTYPVANAYAATEALATHGATKTKLKGGGIAVFDPAHPSSVYVAYRSGDTQIEVYSPTPGAARSIVTAGAVAPVG